MTSDSVHLATFRWQESIAHLTTLLSTSIPSPSSLGTRYARKGLLSSPGKAYDFTTASPAQQYLTPQSQNTYGPATHSRSLRNASLFADLDRAGIPLPLTMTCIGLISLPYSTRRIYSWRWWESTLLKWRVDKASMKLRQPLFYHLTSRDTFCNTVNDRMAFYVHKNY